MVAEIPENLPRDDTMVIGWGSRPLVLPEAP